MKKEGFESYCQEEVGKVYPIVNFNNCGGKESCVLVCPYNVFEMQPISKEDKSKLNLKGKIKTFLFNQKAYVVNPDQCHSCGLCVKACPENAIKLIKFDSKKQSNISEIFN